VFKRPWPFLEMISGIRRNNKLRLGHDAGQVFVPSMKDLFGEEKYDIHFVQFAQEVTFR